MKLSVIVTQESDKKLKSLIEGLKRDSGYDMGLDVRRVSEVPGKYVLEGHNGFMNLTNSCVRVYQGKIITKDAQDMIEGVLRGNKIGFNLYEELISPEIANSPKPNIKLPKSPDLAYTPRKSN